MVSVEVEGMYWWKKKGGLEGVGGGVFGGFGVVFSLLFFVCLCVVWGFEEWFVGLFVGGGGGGGGGNI